MVTQRQTGRKDPTPLHVTRNASTHTTDCIKLKNERVEYTNLGLKMEAGPPQQILSTTKQMSDFCK
jgi:hypothetical protein